MHLLKKHDEIRTLTEDPIINNTNLFRESMDQVLTTHHQQFLGDPSAPIVMLGNSFSWQGHVIDYFSKHPPHTNWRKTRAIIVPYSSSFLEEDNSGTHPYKRRPHPKGHVNEATKDWVLSHLPNHPFSLIDMVKTGAGLASFLQLTSKKPNIIVFEPNTSKENSITHNEEFKKKPVTHLTIPNNQHDTLELMCDNGVRGSLQTKIYDPIPDQKQPTLFYVKKSILIYTLIKQLGN
ncbi:hypothetical protein DID73_00550 [Candidatus Marinamargulisbacteria bacterium SCGC AG-343-K17]|nr:hypothetical protein DID73_00550 [Candidatus Marinamargulisbacteria bacterium SCGC AG-343-K17]